MLWFGAGPLLGLIDVLMPLENVLLEVELLKICETTFGISPRTWSTTVVGDVEEADSVAVIAVSNWETISDAMTPTIVGTAGLFQRVKLLVVESFVAFGGTACIMGNGRCVFDETEKEDDSNEKGEGVATVKVFAEME